MARMVYCVKLKKEAEGLDFPPYPGELGTKIWQNISKQAWQEWMQTQTRLVNENRLNLADARARKYLQQQMQRYLFEDGNVEAQGYVPPGG
ncbi:MAG: oxidative damage protection protein [Pigmentiphaga sp.]|uniref:oxidative damage protection protein n=1 Tax=Pigmentiphaga sp. TaxID=1977564 RepID=UPI0029BB57E2|nr:oxidative damage protection protein [Pigmentiphaga sp.]MDX3907179.1 oxidative damage protection protein [Pigmentiphaga sp.]